MERKHILVVDDDPDLLGLLEDGLSLYGSYAITPCFNGETGLEAVMRQRPDCIIVDVMMPGINGYQFISIIRGDPATEQIPLVILTALTQEHDKILGLMHGADVCLTKPIEFSKLVVAIDRAIRLNSAQRNSIFNQRAFAESHGSGDSF